MDDWRPVGGQDCGDGWVSVGDDLSSHRPLDVPYAEGPLDCKIVFVGEAPGAEESRMGRPFVGPAGQLLDKLLSTTAIIRHDCRIENLFQFRPANNDITPYLNLSKKTPIETQVYKDARDNLLKRLAQTSANVIVPLGNAPLYALMGLKEISKRRGSIYFHPDLKKKVIPTIHPSAALRQYLYKYFIVNDLQRIRKESETPEINLIKRNIATNPSADGAINAINNARNYPMIATDIEVRYGEVSHISIAVAPDKVICIPFMNGSIHNYHEHEEVGIWLALKKLMEDPNVVKVGQNIIFDAYFLYERLGIIINPLDDTMIAQAIAFPEFPKGLDFITSIYCEGEPYYKDEGKIWDKNPFDSEERFRVYNAMDSAVCIEAFPKLMTIVKQMGNERTYVRQKNLIYPLMYIQKKGILIDIEGKKKASRIEARRIDRLCKALNSIAGKELNPNSPKQLKTYFYIDKNVKPFTKQGKPTVDRDALKRLSAKGFREAKALLMIRHSSKMKSSYYDALVSPDGRIRGSYNPVGTKQGRISSSKDIFGYGMNMQTSPLEMSKLMIPDPGYVAVEIDLSQAENRVVAYIANEQRMIQAFETGVDIHRLTASLIFGKPVEEISDKPGSSSIGGGVYSERFWGKKANHGLNYDLGARTFALYYEITTKEAEFIVESYHRNYPGVRMWHSATRDLLARDRTLINCLGRVRKFMDRWGDTLFKEAYSFNPQSTVADQLNEFGFEYIYYNPYLDFIELLNQVHDSVKFQFPISEGSLALAEALIDIKKSMESPISYHMRTFSIPADIKVGFNFRDMEEFKHKKINSLTKHEFANELDRVMRQPKPTYKGISTYQQALEEGTWLEI